MKKQILLFLLANLATIACAQLVPVKTTKKLTGKAALLNQLFNCTTAEHIITDYAAELTPILRYLLAGPHKNAVQALAVCEPIILEDTVSQARSIACKDAVLKNLLNNPCTPTITEAKTGKTNSLFGHLGAVKAPNRESWSPTNEHFLTISIDTTARIWDVKTQNSFILYGHQSPVSYGQFSPTGESVVTGSVDGKVIYWNFVHNTIIVCEGHTKQIALIKFLNHSSFITVSTDDKLLNWNVEENGTTIHVSSEADPEPTITRYHYTKAPAMKQLQNSQNKTDTAPVATAAQPITAAAASAPVNPAVSAAQAKFEEALRELSSGQIAGILAWQQKFEIEKALQAIQDRFMLDRSQPTARASLAQLDKTLATLQLTAASQEVRQTETAILNTLLAETPAQLDARIQKPIDDLATVCAEQEVNLAILLSLTDEATRAADREAARTSLTSADGILQNIYQEIKRAREAIKYSNAQSQEVVRQAAELEQRAKAMVNEAKVAVKKKYTQNNK